MKEKLQAIARTAAREIAAATPEQLPGLRIKYLGRKSELTQCLRDLKKVPAKDRPILGALANHVRAQIETALAAKTGATTSQKLSGLAQEEWLDVTVPPRPHLLGSRHPISLLRRRLEAYFTSLGFEIAITPHMEEEFFNFTGLNIPPDHPAREAHDTFWLTNGRLLRTHNSTVQVHFLKTRQPPFRVINTGRDYRRDNIDASHENTFNQLDGFMVGEGISLSHLLGTLKGMFSYIFARKVNVRFRPSYFPFVEPGGEVDMSCTLCQSKGCPACKNTGWVEMLGCGMTHPNVLALGGIDYHKYTGWAFGMGIDRLAMMLYRINDIRLFNGADLRELRQFA